MPSLISSPFYERDFCKRWDGKNVCVYLKILQKHSSWQEPWACGAPENIWFLLVFFCVDLISG